MWNCELKTRLSDIVSHLRHLSHLSHLSQDKTKLLFSFLFHFIQLCDSRKIHYLTREFRVKLHSNLQGNQKLFEKLRSSGVTSLKGGKQLLV